MTDLAPIKKHITKVKDMQPEDFDTFDDYLNAVKSLFQNNFNSAIYDSTSELWSDRANIPTGSFTIKEFVKATGMNPNTARKELRQGVKKGLFKRVSKGVYEKL